MKVSIKQKNLVIGVSIFIGIILLFVLYSIVASKLNKITTGQLTDTVKAGSIIDILECQSESWDKMNKCYETFFESYLKTHEVKEVLREIETGRVSNTTLDTTCHPITHALGRAAYNKYGNIGDAFERCDFTCNSGCQHGIVERVFYSDEEIYDSSQHLTYDDIVEKVPGICNPKNFKNPTSYTIFQCLHGLGHGILYTIDYNLKDALKSCDLLANTYERESCYGGVFMENVTAFEKTKRDLKKDDIGYPCNVMEDKYRGSCYFLHTSVLLEYGKNFEQIAQFCNEIEAQYQYLCFESLGRDMSNTIIGGNYSTVAKVCQESSGKFKANCINGVVAVTLDSVQLSKQPFEFCNTLSNVNDIGSCYNLIVNYMKTNFNKSKQEMNAACNTFAKFNKDLCNSKVDLNY